MSRRAGSPKSDISGTTPLHRILAEGVFATKSLKAPTEIIRGPTRARSHKTMPEQYGKRLMTWNDGLPRVGYLARTRWALRANAIPGNARNMWLR